STSAHDATRTVSCRLAARCAPLSKSNSSGLSAVKARVVLPTPGSPYRARVRRVTGMGSAAVVILSAIVRSSSGRAVARGYVRLPIARHVQVAVRIDVEPHHTPRGGVRAFGGRGGGRGGVGRGMPR